MDFRIELFVADLDASIRFYEVALGFGLDRREDDYASLRRGQAVLGLGAVSKLPLDAPGPGFTQSRMAADPGAGVEIVFESRRSPSSSLQIAIFRSTVEVRSAVSPVSPSVLCGMCAAAPELIAHGCEPT